MAGPFAKPYDPTRRLPPEGGVPLGRHGLALPCDAFRDWLGHVEAGRIGGNTPVNEEARAIVLANERLICGDGRLPIW